MSTGNKTYRKIKFEERLELINMIENEKISVASAAKKLGFKDSTARFIYTKYKNEGIIF